ncbi:MAG TPA: hypothetical protein VN914_20880 [Polyangia bacterium]|nr:hypothetical protein [Polyangia bacterium]
MPIATRRNDEAGLRRVIAFPQGASLAPFQRRSLYDLGERRPARRLRERAGLPATSRIVLRPLSLR